MSRGTSTTHASVDSAHVADKVFSIELLPLSCSKGKRKADVVKEDDEDGGGGGDDEKHQDRPAKRVNGRHARAWHADVKKHLAKQRELDGEYRDLLRRADPFNFFLPSSAYSGSPLVGYHPSSFLTPPPSISFAISPPSIFYSLPPISSGPLHSTSSPAYHPSTASSSTTPPLFLKGSSSLRSSIATPKGAEDKENAVKPVAKPRSSGKKEVAFKNKEAVESKGSTIKEDEDEDEDESQDDGKKGTVPVMEKDPKMKHPTIKAAGNDQEGVKKEPVSATAIKEPEIGQQPLNKAQDGVEKDPAPTITLKKDSTIEAEAGAKKIHVKKEGRDDKTKVVEPAAEKDAENVGDIIKAVDNLRLCQDKGPSV
ncbi:hypothetical protein B0O80DRAFT_464231 [Mortierella sp. GBAus27b]|nr:hypothetical protein BGX31_009509 [Mortierella sp. GBA43]KAI8348000.1 hypothetical protein B0O80DRAFT_464231 [Mortierella sp. GBAus27b]